MTDLGGHLMQKRDNPLKVSRTISLSYPVAPLGFRTIAEARMSGTAINPSMEFGSDKGGLTSVHCDDI